MREASARARRFICRLTRSYAFATYRFLRSSHISEPHRAWAGRCGLEVVIVSVRRRTRSRAAPFRAIDGVPTLAMWGDNFDGNPSGSCDVTLSRRTVDRFLPAGGDMPAGRGSADYVERHLRLVRPAPAPRSSRWPPTWPPSLWCIMDPGAHRGGDGARAGAAARRRAQGSPGGTEPAPAQRRPPGCGRIGKAHACLRNPWLLRSPSRCSRSPWAPRTAPHPVRRLPLDGALVEARGAVAIAAAPVIARRVPGGRGGAVAHRPRRVRPV